MLPRRKRGGGPLRQLALPEVRPRAAARAATGCHTPDKWPAQTGTSQGAAWPDRHAPPNHPRRHTTCPRPGLAPPYASRHFGHRTDGHPGRPHGHRPVRTPHVTHPRGVDVNAPPIRSPKTPLAPSTVVVRGLITRRTDRRFSAKSALDGHVRTRSVQALRTASATHSPGGGVRLPDRSAARGDVGGGVPQPTGSSTAGRPTHVPWKRSPDGRRRAHAQAHGHTPGARRDRPYSRTDHNPANRTYAP